MKRLFFLSLLFICFVYADSIRVGVGAGYKKPILDILSIYPHSNKIEVSFGNMQQITTQAKTNNLVIVIGDKRYLSTRSNLDFLDYTFIANASAVLAYPKGSILDNVNDLKDTKIQKIAIPQPQKAIYGIAGIEFLENSGLYNSVKEKLLVVATVPQVMTYIIANEVDAGVINLTSALANRDKIGGYIKIDQKYYSPITIVAGVLKGCNTKECKEFIDFLSSNKAKEIFKKYGLE